MAKSDISYYPMSIFGDHESLSKVRSRICHSYLTTHEFTTIIVIYMEYRDSRVLYKIKTHPDYNPSFVFTQILSTTCNRNRCFRNDHWHGSVSKRSLYCLIQQEALLQNADQFYLYERNVCCNKSSK